LSKGDETTGERRAGVAEDVDLTRPTMMIMMFNDSHGPVARMLLQFHKILSSATHIKLSLLCTIHPDLELLWFPPSCDDLQKMTSHKLQI
jgi:hypothetical protein